MATVKIVENMFESTVNTFEAECNQTVEEIIRKQSDGTKYDDYLVECYDCETGETIYAPISDDNENLSVMVTVNGQSQDLDYKVEKNDVIEIVFLPLSSSNNWSWQGAGMGTLVGLFSGALAGAYYGGPWGALIGMGVGAVLGFIGGGLAVGAAQKKSNTSTDGLTGNNLPDTRGASNQNLTGNAFPFVLGKHLATPFIAGSPYNDILGFYGEDNYITALYLVGHSPLKLTELRLGDIILAHNGGRAINDCVYHGRLSDNDIESVWNNNDIKVEILQQGQNGEPVDYQTLYQFAKKQRDVNASVLYIMDNPSEMANVSYKGLSLKNGLRNQPVRYTEEYPKSAKVELNFPSGLYKTYTRTDDDGDSEVKYEKIPLWCAIQWRVSSDANDAPDGEKNGIIANEFRQGMDSWKFTNKRGWQTFNPSQQKAVCTVMNSITSSNETATYLSQRTNSDWALLAREPWTEYCFSTNYDVSYNLDTRYLLIQAITESDLEPTVRNVIADKNYSYSIRLKFEFKWRMTYIISTSYAQTVPKTKNITDTIYKEISGTVYKDDLNSIENDAISIASSLIKVKGDGIDIYGRTPTFEFISSRVSVEYIKIDGRTVTEKGGMKDFVASSLAYSEPAYQDGYLSDLKNAGVTNVIQLSTYDASARTADINAHSGNRSIPDNINDGWLNTQCFNFSELCGSRDKQGGLNEIRFTTEVDFVEWAREKFDGQYSTEEEFNALFKQYFYPASNTTKSIEIRVVRLSPNYQNESSSRGKNSAATFNDVFTWRTLTCTMLDEKAIENNSQIIQKRPLPEEDMRKYCLVAIRAKSDNVDQLSSTLKKFSCTAESFAPYFDKTERKWFPESVTQSYKYFEPNYKDVFNKWHRGAEITEQEFIARRQNGEKAIKAKNGNNFTKDLVTNVIRTQNNLVNGRYVIRGDIQDTYVNGWNLNPYRYLENNVASMILLAGIGAQAGINALSYADYDLISLAKMFEFCESVKDGSTYNTTTWKYNNEGQYVIDHVKGTPVDMKFTANAYIYNAEKLEDIIAKLCIAGRSVVTRNRNNQLTFIVDKPEPYHVALINQANTISSSYSLKYDDNVSGFMITYPDENDGYNQNTLYAMKDAETVEDHRGNIEAYQFAYVTNPYQAWSLGRYLLANKVMNKEVVTKKIGMEGYSIGLGNVVCVQDDTMMIGTDFGGRITELIEDDNYIYGFLINNTYHFTDEREETDNDLVKKGVMVMQPSLSPYEQSRVVILRLAPAGTHKTITRYVDMGNGERTIRTEEFTVKKGQTNVVILKNKVSKHSNYVINDETNEEVDTFLVKPQVDNIIGFGDVNSISALYRVIGIKPDNKHNYELSLLKYQPELYEYGRELPSFQNNMTKRDYVDESYALTESATREDINVYMKQVLDIKNEIDTGLADKVNSITVTLYKRTSATNPTGPTGTATYTFDPDHTGSRLSFTGQGANGWTENVPTGNLPLYATVASIVTKDMETTIASTSWSTPNLMGSDRDTAISVYLYQRSMTEPALPVANLSYNITTGVLTGDTNGWSTNMNDIAVENFTQPLWITTAAAVGKETDVILHNEWSTPLKIIRGEGFTYQIESDISSVTKTLVPAVVQIYQKPNGSVYELEINKCIAEQGDTISCELKRTMGGLIVIEGWWYTIEVMDGYWKTYLSGLKDSLDPLTFSMPNKQIRIRAYKSKYMVEVVDEQIIYYKDNTKTIFYGNNMNMQIPVNTQLYPVNSGSKQVTLEGYIRERETRATAVATTEDLSDQTVLDRLGGGYFQIIDVSLPKDEEGNELVTCSIPNASTVQFNYTIENAIPKEYHGSIKVRYSYEKAISGVGADGRETLNFVFTYDEAKIPFGLISVDNGDLDPSDEDKIVEVNAAYFKPDVPAITFNFTKSDDGAEYEEFEGSYKFSICRDNEWEEVVSGIGTSFTYEFDNNNEKAVDNSVSAYSIALYKDENCTEWVDSETIPVLFNDNQVRANLFNDNVTLVATSSGVIGSLTPTATGLEITKGTKKLKYSTTPITQMGEVDSVGFYNIALGETLNCTGASFDGTNPETLQISAISSLTQDAMYAYRVFNVSYMEIRQGTKIIGKTNPIKIGGRVVIPSKPIYEKIYEVKNLSIVQMIAVVKNGSKQKIEFAVGNFGLDTTDPTVMEVLTWTSSMPTRNSTQCIYMRTDDSES